MLKAIINFFKKPEPSPQAPTPYKIEAPSVEQKADKKPAAKKATDKKPAAKSKPRKPKTPKA